MATSLKKRSEIAEELTWDLTALFETKEETLAALEDVQEEVRRFSSEYDGKLQNAAAIVEALQAFSTIRKQAVRVGQYAFLPVSVDITDAESMGFSRSIQNAMAGVSAQLSFFDSQLSAAHDPGYCLREDGW